MGTLAALGATTAIQVGTSIYGANKEADAAEAQGIYQSNMFNYNAKLADYSASDALKRGDKAVDALGRDVKKTIGSQRAALAAQGIEVDSGSALDVQANTQTLGKLDALQIKNNAIMEAYGYKVEAQQAKTNAQMALTAANTKANNTILTGGINAVNAGVGAVAAYRRT